MSQLFDWRKFFKHYSLAKANHITDSHPALYRRKTAAHKAQKQQKRGLGTRRFSACLSLLLRPPGFSTAPYNPF
jgi:hypothetical protein